MTICRDCNVPMIPVMSFSLDKHEKFNRCPKCFGETKHQKLRDDIVNLWNIEKMLTNVELRYLYLVSLISSDNIYDCETAHKAMEELTFLKQNLHYLNLDDDVLKEVKRYINKGIRIIKNDIKNYQNGVRD